VNKFVAATIRYRCLDRPERSISFRINPFRSPCPSTSGPIQTSIQLTSGRVLVPVIPLLSLRSHIFLRLLQRLLRSRAGLSRQETARGKHVRQEQRHDHRSANKQNSVPIHRKLSRWCQYQWCSQSLLHLTRSNSLPPQQTHARSAASSLQRPREAYEEATEVLSSQRKP